jgi:hypothetical protein
MEYFEPIIIRDEWDVKIQEQKEWLRASNHFSSLIVHVCGRDKSLSEEDRAFCVRHPYPCLPIASKDFVENKMDYTEILSLQYRNRIDMKKPSIQYFPNPSMYVRFVP